jgi:hypothetical protein
MKRSTAARGNYVQILLRLPRVDVLALNLQAKRLRTPRAAVLRLLVRLGIDKFQRQEKLQKKAKAPAVRTAREPSTGARRNL